MPTLDISVTPQVKLITSFDQWVPEEMKLLSSSEQLSRAYTHRTVRPPSHPSAPATSCDDDGGGGVEKTSGGGDPRYPYKGHLRLNRLPVTVEDARGVASSAFSFSLATHTRRRYSDAGSTQSADVNNYLQGGDMGEGEGKNKKTVDEDVLELINREADLDSPRKDRAEVEPASAPAPAPLGEGEDREGEGQPHVPTGSTTYLMDEDDNDEARAGAERPRYSLHRMVPPGVHYYCLRVNDHELTFDPFQPHVSTLSLIKLGLQRPLSHLLHESTAPAPALIARPPTGSKREAGKGKGEATTTKKDKTRTRTDKAGSISRPASPPKRR